MPKTVKVWSPEGVLKEIAPLNANDLVAHLGYTRTPPIVAVAAKTETTPATQQTEIVPDPNGTDEQRQAWLDNVGTGADTTVTNTDDDDESGE